MKYVEWGDPWPGLDENSNEVTCHRICRMTVEDAIKSMRHVVKRLNPDMVLPSNETLLDEFMVVNWASIIEVPNEQSQQPSSESIPDSLQSWLP